MAQNEEFIKEFIAETRDLLDQLDNDLVGLESDPRDEERLDSAFRVLHTIKGNSGFFQFNKIGGLSHSGESLLTRLRNEELELSTDIVSSLLAHADAVRQILLHIEETGNENDRDYSGLQESLTNLSTPQKVDAPAPGEVTMPPTIEFDSSSVPDDVPETPKPTATPKKRTASKKKTTKKKASKKKSSVKKKSATKIPIETTEFKAPADDKSDFGSSVSSTGGSTRLGANISGSDVRVGVELLDTVMNLIGELVLARNQILQVIGSTSDMALAACSQRLNKVTSELQDSAMKMRMQGIGTLWQRFPRLVRDLALQCDKKVELSMFGAGTELDKSLIESINDPLTHIVRNAIDHGIETPARRQKNGKPETGRLTLNAFHESGQVIIEITDDGAGMDVGRIKKKAVQQGMISEQQLNQLGDQTILNLAYLPGFSTADAITNLSGRGVGMDVVRANIESIGGSVEIQSQLGEGTTIRLKIPLTLAIVPAIMITTCGRQFAIPQANLIEMVSFEGEAIQRAIDHIYDSPVFRLRDEVLPLVNLNQQLALDSTTNETNADELNIVVLRAEGKTFGLQVDEINNTEEIVVKPVGNLLNGLPEYAGATIMGDGRLALILDAGGLASRAAILTDKREVSELPTSRKNAGALAQDNLLVCRLSGSRQIALPISQVVRLEQVQIASIEKSKSQIVIQYRGQIIPLVDLHACFDERISDDVQRVQLIVHNYEGYDIGFIVEQIIDVVEQPVETKAAQPKNGIVGTAVVEGRVTDIVDLNRAVRDLAPEVLDFVEM